MESNYSILYRDASAIDQPKDEAPEVKPLENMEMGCCVYPDINNPGQTLCADNWSASMCAYAGGVFHPGELCSDQ